MSVEEERLPVYWRDQLVGVMVNPKVEMFSLYGDWEPAEGAVVAEFLTALEKEEDQEVFLGGRENRKAIVMRPPDTDIEARFYPGS
ncbi:hypothetical protein [Pyxidicoccus caerfyrddinensis]|uniref:hypothetical protein n=1 Tax=Pyxidicoccus caerfyrddinensis TaxID=2709663 RepID=UPI0013D8E268|nr:hypothetical protein [Pyxidicoccus caerfyrddinensis]